MSGSYEARVVAGGMPTDCCDYGVVSLGRGVEVCRVWREEDACLIADLLNARTTPSQGLDAATVERCAREAAALAFDARARKAKHPDVVTLERHHAKVIRQGEGDDYDAVQAARIALERFAALATDPHQHGGKGA